MTLSRMLSILLICGGAFLIQLSYTAHAKWWEYMVLNDPSGAEAYEVEYWITIAPAFTLLVAGAFLLGLSFAKNGN